uniref:Uncharacterized protein n=1 Tax=Arundo donax TaxID=35708 RepID=A0A0A8YNP2_ARUDO
MVGTRLVRLGTRLMRQVVTTVTYPELMPAMQESLWKTNHLQKARKS